jgi:hypothetical protein
MIPFYWRFRRVQREAREVTGMLKALFLIEDVRTCYTLSLWQDDAAILSFNTRARSHIDVANSAFGLTYRDDLKRPEIWSAQFRLWAVSCHNMNWQGLNLESILADQWSRRTSAAMAPPEDAR